MSTTNPRARHHVLGIVALSLFAALFTRLWYLQVLTTDDYELAARNNRTREVISDAPRGRILDRNGTPLVENRRTIQITISYQDFTALDEASQGEVLRRLARELTEDQLLRHEGTRVENDPGAVAPEGAVDEEGDDGGAVDDEAAGATGDDEDAAVRPTPAGVATGARNPDGQGPMRREAPEAITEDTLRERLEDPRFEKFKPVPVATDVSEQLEVYLRERPELFPTVTAERVTVRDYHYGALLAHVLGYVGSITDTELDEFQNPSKPYENDDQIGKTGIERGLEPELRGTPGRVVYEVDARNRPVREITDQRREPRAGNDVYLTVDINLQYLVEKGLAAEIERRRGVIDDGCWYEECDPPGAGVVALDPDGGEVLAMASYPTYDPNLFVGGITTRDYEAISDPEEVEAHHDPLSNRAIAGQYPPGSTFKLFSAYAGLAADQIEPSDIYDDTGIYRFREDCDTSVEVSNCYKRNAGRKEHGPVDLSRALTVSSDTYFYKLGNEAWLRRDAIGDAALQEQMELWGLGQTSGIDLRGEAPGRVPTPTWLREFSEEINAENPDLAEEAGTWNGGISANTVIGQGDVLATPLQLANGYAAVANGGTVYLPQLVLQVTKPASASMVDAFAPEVISEVPLPAEWRDPLIAGFDGVTKPGTGGTAATTFTGFDQSACPVAGKTGTSQATDQNDTSLFVAFAPTHAPTIAVSAVVEQAGFGSSAAVPLVRRVLEPFAAGGCTIAGPDGTGSAFPPAPLGGWFDVEVAMAEFTPEVVEVAD
ncbi:penicillin-binding transpeptidase domain-containing protein [Iamia sp.]|uniref:penicillin-binding transpeptidase domain-containing protein n=1 Tax=Iamia sp. TaxID=2722710 RepID=UPI002C884CA5|nr:penicillin-binding transpeptidase domain-containing protein [Iamia sp.]HXH57044.1 penicillin-binding transpeptidase domain-containing protein [Iamia sp.]